MSDPNRELMKVMGASGYSAVPPDQHGWQFKDKDQPPLHRMWSWMIDHTCAFGNTDDARQQKKAWASKGSTALYMEHMAAELGYEPHYCREIWREGVQLGLWRDSDPKTKKEGKRRLILCGRVKPLPEKKPVENGGGSVQSRFPSYISKQTKDWPLDKLRKCEAEFVRNRDAEKELLADLVKAGRRIAAEQIHDTWARRWGLELIRLDDAEEEQVGAKPNGQPGAESAVRVAIEGYVQTRFAFVQSSESAPYSDSGGTVHRPHPYRSTTTNKGKQKRGVGEAQRSDVYSENPSNNNNNGTESDASGPDVVVVESALKKYGSPAEGAALKLLKDCRARKPDCPVEDVAAVIDALAAGFTKTVANPIGLLLTRVPLHIATYERGRAAAAAASAAGEPGESERARKLRLQREEEGVWNPPRRR